MTGNPKHSGTITDGKLKLDNRELFKWDLENFEGQDIELIIKGVRSTRSNKMNRYYWSVIVGSLQSYFNQESTFDHEVSPEDVHDILKSKFLGCERVFLPDGQTLDVVRSSRRLDNQEFIQYFERIIAWCMSILNLELPLPNEFIEVETEGAK